MRRTKTTYQHPARLEGTRRRFERWRATREGRACIPERLWALAVKAARRYGVSQASRVLRLDYYSLKKRVEATGWSGEVVEGGSGHAPERAPGAGFIELATPASAGIPPSIVPECCLELEDPRGVKMRIHLKGASAPDLAALSRSFWISAATGAGERAGA